MAHLKYHPEEYKQAIQELLDLARVAQNECQDIWGNWYSNDSVSDMPEGLIKLRHDSLFSKDRNRNLIKILFCILVQFLFLYKIANAMFETL